MQMKPQNTYCCVEGQGGVVHSTHRTEASAIAAALILATPDESGALIVARYSPEGDGTYSRRVVWPQPDCMSRHVR